MTPDEQLASSACSGDREAFDTLVQRHARRVFHFAYARLRDEHDAEEVTQETFLRVWTARSRFDDRRSFTTWLLAIAYRETVNILRCRQRDAKLRDLPVTAPAGSARASERSNIWTVAARVLGDDAYATLYLRYACERTPGEIASILGRRPTAVRVALHRAVRRLERELGEAAARGTPALATTGGEP